MKNKTFKIIYAGVLIFIGVVVNATMFALRYGTPIYIRRMNWMGTETISIDSGRIYGLVETLELLIPPTIIWIFLVFVAGIGIFWFKEKKLNG